MVSDQVVTFAYGSNMPTSRIRERCPSATALGVGELRGYELRWHKASKDGSGKADIVQSDKPGSSVFGVLYSIAVGEKPALDRAEGLGHGYEEVQLTVLSQGQDVSVTAYKATNIDPQLKPYSWYKALAVAGAKEHELPEAYIGQLLAAPAKEDNDRGRHDLNMRLISGGQK